MKRIVLRNGLIAGLIMTAMMVIGTAMLHDNPDFKGSMVLGFLGMFVAFSFTFIGIRQYRERHNGGHITFGRALAIGALISLVASVMYVAVWAIEYHFFFPDFMEQYTEVMMKNLRESGASAAEIAQKEAENRWMADNYSNPLFFIGMTLMEVLPIGLVISLISAALLRKKPDTGGAAELGHS